MNRYDILADNLPRLEKKLTTIANKCHKFGCEFTYNNLGEFFKEVEIEPATRYTPAKTELRKYVTVEVEGTAIVNDWQFVATIDHEETGNVIRKAVEVEIPKRYYTSDCYCEHCKTKRQRKNTYLVQNLKTGEFKQVGNSCLNDFTHGMSAEAVATYIAAWDELIKGYEPYTGGSYTTYLPTKEILAYSAELTNKLGYVSSGNIRSTRSLTDDYWCLDNRPSFLHEKVREVLVEDKEKYGLKFDRPENTKLVEDALAWLKEQDGDSSDYIHNMQVICLQDGVQNKDLGFCCSLINTYNKAMQRKTEADARRAANAQARKTSKHVGSIGDRITVETTSWRCVTSWENEFGTTFLYKFTDIFGNVFTWKTGICLDSDVVLQHATFKGTVKNHSEFNGVQETEMTRCKFIA